LATFVPAIHCNTASLLATAFLLLYLHCCLAAFVLQIANRHKYKTTIFINWIFLILQQKFTMQRFEIPEKKQPVKPFETFITIALCLWLLAGLYNKFMLQSANSTFNVLAPTIFLISSIISIYQKQKKQQAFIEINDEGFSWDWYGVTERKIVFWNDVVWTKKENGNYIFCSHSSFIISFPLQEINSNKHAIEQAIEKQLQLHNKANTL
jgi:hypothetical protein